MTIKHHLDDATLMSLSAGTLGEALTLVAAAHIEVCHTCRKRLREMDFIGASMLNAIAPSSLSRSAQSDSTMGMWESCNGNLSVSSKFKHKQSGVSDLPLPIGRMVGRCISDIPWKWIGPGVATYTINLSSHATGDLRLLKVAPNTKLPEHGHGGGELTFIVSGAYRDKFGLFGPGDIADVDEDVEHRPIVEPGEACICIVGSESPAKFKGPIARILQPLIGM